MIDNAIILTKEEYENAKNNIRNSAYKQGRADEFEELKSLLRCRNYRGCIGIKGCDGVCRINSDICKSCENFGIPYSLLEQMQKEVINE